MKDEWDKLLGLLADGASDHEIAKQMKPYWGSNQEDRLGLAQNGRRAYYGTVHNYANPQGGEG